MCLQTYKLGNSENIAYKYRRVSFRISEKLNHLTSYALGHTKNAPLHKFK